MNKRVSLKERRENDATRGVDAIFKTQEQPQLGEEPQGKAALAKVTIYIRPDQILAVESIQLAERKRTGKRRDKSELYQEAIDLLAQKYAVQE